MLAGVKQHALPHAKRETGMFQLGLIQGFFFLANLENFDAFRNFAKITVKKHISNNDIQTDNLWMTAYLT